MSASKTNQNTTMTVEVYVQNSGRALYYPFNDTAKQFMALIGKKCFSPEHIALIKELGYKVMQVPNPTIQETKEI